MYINIEWYNLNIKGSYVHFISVLHQPSFIDLVILTHTENPYFIISWIYFKFIINLWERTNVFILFQCPLKCYLYLIDLSTKYSLSLVLESIILVLCMVTLHNIGQKRKYLDLGFLMTLSKVVQIYFVCTNVMYSEFKTNNNSQF